MLYRVQRSVLEHLLEDADVVENDVRWDYSGRAMYGRTCFGFTGDVSALVAFAVEVGRHQAWFDESGDDSVHPDLSELVEALKNVKSDSLGFDTIFYLPRLVVEND